MGSVYDHESKTSPTISRSCPPLTDASNKLRTPPSVTNSSSKSRKVCFSPEVQRLHVRRALFQGQTQGDSLYNIFIKTVNKTIAEDTHLCVSMFAGYNRQAVVELISSLEKDGFLNCIGDESYTIDPVLFFSHLFGYVNLLQCNGVLCEVVNPHIISILEDHGIIKFDEDNITVLKNPQSVFDYILSCHGSPLLRYKDIFNLVCTTENSLLCHMEISNFLNKGTQLGIFETCSHGYLVNTQLLCQQLYKFTYSFNDFISLVDIDKYSCVVFTAIHRNIVNLRGDNVYQNKDILLNNGNLHHKYVIENYSILIAAENINNTLLLCENLLNVFQQDNKTYTEADLMYKLGIKFPVTLKLLCIPCCISYYVYDNIVYYQQESCQICANIPDINNLICSLDCCNAQLCFDCYNKISLKTQIMNMGENVCAFCNQFGGHAISTICGLPHTNTCSVDIVRLSKIANMKVKISPKLLATSCEKLFMTSDMNFCYRNECSHQPMFDTYMCSMTGSITSSVNYCKGCLCVTGCNYHAPSILCFTKGWNTGLCNLCSGVKKFVIQFAQSSSKPGKSKDKRVFKWTLPEFQSPEMLIYSPEQLCNVKFDFNYTHITEDITYSWALLAYLEKLDLSLFSEYFGIGDLVYKHNVIEYDKDSEETESRQSFFSACLWELCLNKIDSQLLLEWNFNSRTSFIFADNMDDISGVMKFIHNYSLSAGNFYLFSKNFVLKIFNDNPHYENLVNEIHHNLKELHDSYKKVYASNTFDLISKVFIQKTHDVLGCDMDTSTFDMSMDSVADWIHGVYYSVFEEDDSKSIDEKAKEIPLRPVHV